MIFPHRQFTAVALALGFSLLGAPAAPIPVPNHSFETPDITFADPGVGTPWQQMETTVDQVGTFDNPPPGSVNGDHIDNMDGAQGIFIFAGALIGVFQDLLGATFDIGQAYTLTIGLGGSGETLPTGSVFEFLFYYRDQANSKVPIALSQVPFDPALDPGKINHLFDYSVSTPVVQASDAWAGKNIGLELRTNSAPGGYWDVDNVRLESVPEPTTFGLAVAGLLALGLRRSVTMRR